MNIFPNFLKLGRGLNSSIFTCSGGILVFPAFAFLATIHWQYCPPYCGKIQILSLYYDNIVNILWQYCPPYCQLPQYGGNFTTLWPHTVNIYAYCIVEVNNMLDSIVAICWQYCHKTVSILWVFLQYSGQYCQYIVTILWQKMWRLVL